MQQPDLTSWSTLEAQLNAVQPDPDQSSGIPPACYADNEVLKQEINAVFLRGWVCLGREDRWKNPGDYTAMDLAGTPIIVLRNKQGRLKVFANSCRHRGSMMLEGDGNCSKIKCPFHWWTYDLDGALKVFPRMEDARNFNPKDYGLVEFQLQCSDGFAFVCFENEAPPFAEWIGDFGNVHLPWAMHNLESTRVREFEVDCNWKTFIEVFNEYYHLPSVHPDSLSWLYPEPEPADQVSGNFTTQFGDTLGVAALMPDNQGDALPVASQLQGRERSGTRYSWVYPNMTFAASQDSFWMYQVFPVTAHRCRVIQTICFPAESVARDDFDEKVSHYYTRFDAALEEDIPFLKKQQIGLTSKFARPGRFGTLEPSVGNFAYWYAQQMLKHLNTLNKQ
ncbi:MAG: phenylpropionate dioxygenase-like ring-hydroxylating dioxygenase large terminal subunit [Gammaproteobacteria bacterium]|jgi:phenylpropionate dioxygenase-like ring-hydroxylating dioxygenase large terminal subunit